MGLPQYDRFRYINTQRPADQITIDTAFLVGLREDVRRILDESMGKCPKEIRDQLYAIKNRLWNSLSTESSRVLLVEDFWNSVIAFFGAESTEEIEICNRFSKDLLDASQYWLATWPTAWIKEELQRARVWLESKQWIDYPLAPSKMPAFLEMCERKFGKSVSRRMRAHADKRAEAALAKKAKKAAKKKAAEETVNELKKSPVFDSEGGFKMRESSN